MTQPVSPNPEAPVPIPFSTPSKRFPCTTPEAKAAATEPATASLSFSGIPSSASRHDARPFLLGLVAFALSGCAVDHGSILNFDAGRSKEAFAKARGTCRYDVARIEFRSRRTDSGHELFIACMESKGFPFRSVSGYWVDRLCPAGTPGRKSDGTCRERRRLDGSPM